MGRKKSREKQNAEENLLQSLGQKKKMYNLLNLVVKPLMIRMAERILLFGVFSDSLFLLFLTKAHFLKTRCYSVSLCYIRYKMGIIIPALPTPQKCCWADRESIWQLQLPYKNVQTAQSVPPNPFYFRGSTKTNLTSNALGSGLVTQPSWVSHGSGGWKLSEKLLLKQSHRKNQ